MDVERLAEDIFEGIKSVIDSNCDAGTLKELESNAEKLFTYYKNNDFDIDYEVEVALLDYDKCDEISRLVNDSSWDGRGENPTDCVSLLEIIFKYICPLAPSFEIILACNPNTPIEILRELAKSNFWDEEHATTQSIAEYTFDSDLLELLSSSPHGATKWYVAQNQATSSQTLDKLASDSGYVGYMRSNGESSYDIFVQCNVIDNPNTSIEALKKIADGTYKIVDDSWNEDFLRDINSQLQEQARLS
jgi:hypothetical protein